MEGQNWYEKMQIKDLNEILESLEHLQSDYLDDLSYDSEESLKKMIKEIKLRIKQRKRAIK